MSGLDLEDLLRRTYADIAERTAVVDPADVDLIPLRARTPERPRWPMVAAAAAVIVLVIAATLVLRRDEPAPAGIDESRLVHAVPGYLPNADESASFNAPSLPLRSIESAPDRDVIVFGSDEVTFTMTVGRGPDLRPAGDIVPVRGGLAATRTPDSLWWTERPGVTVHLRLTGVTDPFEALQLTADSLVFVDGTAWGRATDHAGFLETDDAGTIAEYRLRTDVPVTVTIRGRLQWGYEFAVEGVPTSFGPADAACSSAGVAGRWVTHGNGGVATVAIDGTTPFDVALSERIPGTATRLAVYDLDLPDSELGHSSSTTCTEVAP